MGPTWGPPGPRWAPCRPHEPCYLGWYWPCKINRWLSSWRRGFTTCAITALMNNRKWNIYCCFLKYIQLMMTSSNGNIFHVTGPLCREFTSPSEFPTQRPVTRSFDVLFDLHLNKRFSKQPWGCWFETPSWSFWRQCNANKGSYSFKENDKILFHI